jgi:hypothetical protein
MNQELEAKGSSAYTTALIGVVINLLALATPLTIPHAFIQNTPTYATFLLFSNLSLSGIIFASIPKPHDDAEEVKSKQWALTAVGAIFLITMLMALLACHGGSLSAPLIILDAVGFIATAASYAAVLTYTHELASCSITN